MSPNYRFQLKKDLNLRRCILSQLYTELKLHPVNPKVKYDTTVSVKCKLVFQNYLVIFRFCCDLVIVFSSSLFRSTWKLYSSFSWLSWYVAFICCSCCCKTWIITKVDIVAVSERERESAKTWYCCWENGKIILFPHHAYWLCSWTNHHLYIFGD